MESPGGASLAGEQKGNRVLEPLVGEGEGEGDARVRRGGGGVGGLLGGGGVRALSAAGGDVLALGFD